GHDLGHTPFGHAGETALNEVYAPGFHHAEQSLRLVDRLESTRHGPGLNLTFEVRDGIRNHSKGKAILAGQPVKSACTLEGDIVSVCDAIAYISHDIDDAIRGGLITPDDLPRDAVRVVGTTASERIDRMVGGLVHGSRDGAIAMEDEVREATVALRAFLYESLYPGEAIHREITKAKKLLVDLYAHLLEHPTPDSAAGSPEDSLERRTVDFVAGMTDQYAFHLYRRIFMPSAWPA
ncbi:MAG: deoxyguanosinetriphosphate triphosphohydrolase, partial [Candidatus Hydrogenedentes bacterium]|nr:deoxyguanosinetriphosphate triphosphohydrolase [Candidatus Hydrogenedentota bacterium]